MSQRRFDNRTKAGFSKDIKFGTEIESFWIKLWLEEVKHWPEYEILSVNDHGVDNSGGYVSKSNGNADYYIKYNHYNVYTEHPLEIKWAPANDKATFKIQDLNNYYKSEASILFIFNTCSFNLKRPSSYNHVKHIETITSYMEHIKWGIIDHNNIRKMLNSYVHFPVPYMGNKPGIIVPPADFKNFMIIREMRHLNELQ